MTTIDKDIAPLLQVRQTVAEELLFSEGCFDRIVEEEGELIIFVSL